MKWLLLLALGAAFAALLSSTPETNAIEVARTAAEPSLVRA